MENRSSGGVLKKSCNLGQNTYRLFQVLAELPFKKNVTKLGFYHYRWSVRVAQQVVARLKP